MAGRGGFVRSPHSRPSFTRRRGVRRDTDGRYIEADGLRWTNAEKPVATRTDAPLAIADLLRIPPGEPLYTYDALQTADNGHLRQLHRTYVPFSVLVGTKYEEKAPPPAPALCDALTDLGHELHFTEYVRTRMPQPDQAQALRLSDGVPMLHILRVTHSTSVGPVALEEFHLPGSDLELTYPLWHAVWLRLSLRLQGGSPPGATLLSSPRSTPAPPVARLERSSWKGRRRLGRSAP